MTELTLALQSVGEGGASEEILPLIYHDLRRQAGAQMAAEPAGQTLQPTALVHEAWLRIVAGKRQRWENRAHFFGAAAEAMRRILIENARRKLRLKRGAGHARVNIEDVELAEATPEEKILLIDEAMERLREEDPERAQIVLLKFYGGFSNKEVAASLGMAERSVERHWAYAKAWLFEGIRERR
ncbi:MAG: ECF-type sigma factor [Opitutus sp.]|nr:ECF-type sigma factor [Opitutus sp.]